ncbi:MAG TPA: ABC-2 family transporter protein [Thermoclostridium sp.]
MQRAVMKKGNSTPRVSKAVITATYKENFAYRNQMAVSIFVQPIYFLVHYFIWQAIFQTRDQVSGFTFDQMLLYFAVSSLVEFMNWDSSGNKLQRLIQTGQFITFQLRPVSHIYFSFCEKIGQRILAFLVEILPVMCFYILFGIRLIPAKPVWAVISLLLSFVLSFLIRYTIGIFAFWFVKTDGVSRAVLLLTNICSGAFLPLNLYPQGFQKFLFYLPFQFVSYVPVRVFIGHYELAGITMTIPQIVFLQAVMVGVMFLVNRALWYLGIKRFAGVGA